MKKSDFIKLHMSLSINLPKSIENNPIPSATDPTQDIPIRMIEVSAAGVPLNVREVKCSYNGITADKLSSIDSRNCDVFDQLREYQNLTKRVARPGVSITNPKNPKKNEKE